MRKYPVRLRFIAVSILLVGIAYLLPWQAVNAAKFSQVTLKLDRLKAHTALSGTLCAVPSTAGAGAEGKVLITFPSDFTINTTESSWTTDTDNLPSGSTAWPGISTTASNISSKTVTFTSNDLTSSVNRYCFDFQTSGSTTGSAGNKVGTVKTQTSGSVTIDQTDVGIPIVNNDGVTITATVPANPTDFTVALNRLTPGPLFTEFNEVEYEITYGSLLSYATDMAVEASWGLGTIAGTGSPSVLIAEYITGSASSGYSGVLPIIDLINRKITWTYSPSFPGDTIGEKVKFKLRTTKNYTGEKIVSFDVSGRVLGPGTATDYKTTSTNYQFSNFAPTPIPGPTATPTTGPGPTATPTPPPSQAPSFESIDIRTISSDNAVIDIVLSRPGTVTLQYGLSPNAMNERIVSLTPSTTHRLEFADLLENTQYYFRIIVTDESGRRNTSDIFTFTTAIKSDPPKIDLASLIATSNNTIIFSPSYRREAGNKNILVLPAGTLFEMKFTIGDGSAVKEILLLVRNKGVLGINNIVGDVDASSDSVPMFEISPGVFTGRLESKITPGEYEIFSRIHDFNGNLTEEKVAEMRISDRFTILDQSDNPIENARVTLFLYNENLRTYQYISPQTVPITNPSYSEPDGSVPIVLPPGKYRAEMTDPRHKSVTIDFTIGQYPGEDYPIIKMESLPFTLNATVTYLAIIASDIIHAGRDFTGRLSTSGRFFELNMLIVFICFVLLSVVALSAKLRIPITQLPWYFSHLLFLHSVKSMQKVSYRGTVLDEKDGSPLAGTDVYLYETESGQILLHATTNSKGEFSFPILPIFTYHLEIAKPMYHSGHFAIRDNRNHQEQTFALVQRGALLNIKENSVVVGERILGILFEFILLVTFLLMIVFIFTFGIAKALPVLILAICNLLFWILHENHKTHHAF